MKIFIKPIQFSFKDEFSIEIEGSKTINELIGLIKAKYNEVTNASFLYRGKKLVNDKTLNDQGLKDSIKLMMNKIEGEATSIHKVEESTVEINKSKAKAKLIEAGYAKELVESIINTIPNIQNLSLETIIEKATIFLTNLSKESNLLGKLDVQEFSMEIEEDKVIKFNEDNICSVYAVGNGIQGQLGVGNYLKTDLPMKVYGLKGLKIRKICCGVYHSLALDINGYGK